MTTGTTLALAGLGAFHGLNPAMGWLLAVAIGLQERSRWAMARSLAPIGAGHFVSIAAVAVAVTVGASAWTTRVVAVAGGAALLGMGMWRLLSKRHFTWVGMRLSAWQLAAWSFLMASVHGAGLMLVPVLASGGRNGPAGHLGHTMASEPGTAAKEPGGRTTGLGEAAVHGLLAAGVHTVAMLAVGAVIAFVVYQFVGLTILRTAWINLDLIWAVVLLAAGLLTLVGVLV
ncbi:hypothetical protein SAMN05421678_107206 [Actinopolymorpha cephalotaxi]|uniref:Uncharacterized protein n=1 Tax=Actinopolymorpha cephalotaxi TaxID=504797 RepID=A0A1I2TK96_9ACTN|nr:hypothetical protein [Actinopolymorpha cephalotaxi]NYH83100.1 hypothetical protein [Actinopolymorpha cephalotaxi]SFG64559.1 hypothetical protein SAMN05421678_107206 [Actinopolymorpha cephalotaxi]